EGIPLRRIRIAESVLNMLFVSYSLGDADSVQCPQVLFAIFLTNESWTNLENGRAKALSENPLSVRQFGVRPPLLGVMVEADQVKQSLASFRAVIQQNSVAEAIDGATGVRLLGWSGTACRSSCIEIGRSRGVADRLPCGPTGSADKSTSVSGCRIEIFGR